MDGKNDETRDGRTSLTTNLQRLLALGSLARLARWRARREEDHSWPVTLVLGRWRWTRAHWRDRTYYAIAAFWTGLIFVPFPNDWNPFSKAEAAEGFLRTLWQVEAAALALSLAIIVFAVQAYRAANEERYGALRRYIRASWLQEGYEQGVVALLITAVVLIGAGHGGPAGSAGVVAGLACLFSVFMLPPLLNGALRTSRRGFLTEEREGRLTVAVSEQVDREVEARHGAALLTELAATEPIELDPFALGKPERKKTAILAGVVGSVADIRLRRLVRLARREQAVGGVTVTTRLYDFLGAESQLLLLPATVGTSDMRRADRVVTVKPGRWRDETLRKYLKDLEEEALAAIRAGTPGTFESIESAYVETLMEFPRSWARYGHEYSIAIAQGIEFFPVGPVDTIRQQFYTNIVEALRGTSDEVLLTAAYLPISVCTRALQYRADGLLAKMVGLSTAFVVAGWTHGGDKGNLLADRMPRHLIEFTRIYLRPRLEQGDIADRLRFGSYVRLVYDQIGAILKLAVDHGYVDYLHRVDGDWDTLLEHWHVDTFSSHPAVLHDLEEAANRGEAGAAERLEEARAEAQLTALRQELSDRRTVLRFGLALWAWRQQPRAWRESFTYFATQLGGITRLARIATQAIEAEFRDRGGAPWSDWALGTLQEGRAHVIDTAGDAMATFIAAAIRAIRLDDPTPELPAAEWMLARLDQARDLITAAVTDIRNDDVPDVAERAVKVQEALEAGAEAWRERERQSTIEASVVPDKVSGFREQTRTSLAQARIVPDLLRLAGAVTKLEAPPVDRGLIQWEQHKGFFTADGRYVGLEMIARDIGRDIAHRELRSLLQPMADVEPHVLVTDHSTSDEATRFVEQLRPLVARAVKTAPPTALVVLLPILWQLTEALGLAFLGSGTAPPQAWGLSKGAAHDFAGVFEGAAAYTFPQVPGDRLYVVDLSRYVSAETWDLSDEQAVAVDTFTEDEARSRARQDPGRDEIGEDEIARRWREMALIRVDPGLRLCEQRDSAALTAISLPTALVGDIG